MPRQWLHEVSCRSRVSLYAFNVALDLYGELLLCFVILTKQVPNSSTHIKVVIANVLPDSRLSSTTCARAQGSVTIRLPTARILNLLPSANAA